MRDLHTLDKYRDTIAEREIYGGVGDAGNGCIKLNVGGRSYFLVGR